MVAVSPTGDGPALPAFRARLLVVDGYLDLAVLRIVADADGAPLSAPRCPATSRVESARRHCWVDGWRPVPKAMPGSSSRTIASPGSASDQVGRTRTRLMRSGVNDAFQDSSQSSSSTRRSRSLPIGPSPNACR